MKRFLAMLGALLLIGAGVLLFLRYDASRELKGDASDFKTAAIQIEPHVFYRVRVPSEAILERSNYETVYEYDLLTVSKLDALPRVYDSKRSFGNTNIIANSKDKILAATQEGFDTEETYAVYVDWEQKEYVDGLPVAPDLPDDTVQVPNSTYVPKNSGETIVADNSTVWYTTDGFLQGSVIFSEYQLAIDASAAKFKGLYGMNFQYYYHQDAIFYAESGDFYVGVRYINKNTQYVISGKGSVAKPYFLQSLINGANPVGNGGEGSFIPKETTSGEIN
jgi:hypothetical protein